MSWEWVQDDPMQGFRDQIVWPTTLQHYKRDSQTDSFDVWDSDPRVGRGSLNGKKTDYSIIGFVNGKLRDRPEGGENFDYDYINGSWVKKTWSRFEIPPLLKSLMKDPDWAYDFRQKQWTNITTNQTYKPPEQPITGSQRKNYIFMGQTAYIPDQVYNNEKLHLGFTTQGWTDLANPSHNPAHPFNIYTYNFKKDKFQNTVSTKSLFVDDPNDPTEIARGNSYLMVGGLLLGILIVRNLI